MPDKPPPPPPHQPGGARTSPKRLKDGPQDARPDDLGQEGAESNVKPNTSGGGRRTDRGP